MSDAGRREEFESAVDIFQVRVAIEAQQSSPETTQRVIADRARVFALYDDLLAENAKLREELQRVLVEGDK